MNWLLGSDVIADSWQMLGGDRFLTGVVVLIRCM